jgi:hypothetical protein
MTLGYMNTNVSQRLQDSQAYRKKRRQLLLLKREKHLIYFEEVLLFSHELPNRLT